MMSSSVFEVNWLSLLVMILYPDSDVQSEMLTRVVTGKLQVEIMDHLQRRSPRQRSAVEDVFPKG